MLIDSDCVSRSNINRQLCALESTVGRPKVEVIAVSEANTRNLLDNAVLVMTVDVAKNLEEALA